MFEENYDPDHAVVVLYTRPCPVELLQLAVRKRRADRTSRYDWSIPAHTDTGNVKGRNVYSIVISSSGWMQSPQTVCSTPGEYTDDGERESVGSANKLTSGPADTGVATRAVIGVVTPVEDYMLATDAI
eukprot:417843_1